MTKYEDTIITTRVFELYTSRSGLYGPEGRHCPACSPYFNRTKNVRLTRPPDRIDVPREPMISHLLRRSNMTIVRSGAIAWVQQSWILSWPALVWNKKPLLLPTAVAMMPHSPPRVYMPHTVGLSLCRTSHHTSASISSHLLYQAPPVNYNPRYCIPYDHL
jgi:hypothetical protein